MPCNGQIVAGGVGVTDRQGLHIAHTNGGHVWCMLWRRRNPKALSKTDQ